MWVPPCHVANNENNSKVTFSPLLFFCCTAISLSKNQHKPVCQSVGCVNTLRSLFGTRMSISVPDSVWSKYPTVPPATRPEGEGEERQVYGAFDRNLPVDKQRPCQVYSRNHRIDIYRVNFVFEALTCQLPY